MVLTEEGADMKNKRLMILIWGMGVGGIQKRVRDIVVDISENRPDWDVYMTVKYRNPDYFSEEISSKSRVFFNYFSESNNNKFNFGLLWIIREYLRTKPNVCLTFLDHFSIIMVWLRKVFFWQKTRIILNEGILTSKYLDLYRQNNTWLWRFLIKKSYRLADKVIVPTVACKKDLLVNFNVPERRIEVINNWTLYKEGLTNGKNELIYVGRFDEDKKVMDFIEIIMKTKLDYPKVKLVMLGEGNLDKLLKEEIDKRDLKKNIEVMGFSKEVRRHLCDSKVFVLPSINEGLPNVVLEAAMCGVPTVSNSFSGVEEVIENEKTGFITSNIDEMVEKIKMLLGSELKRKRMGDNAKRLVLNKFSKENQTKFVSIVLD